MIRGGLLPPCIERDIAREREDGRRKEIRKWPVKVWSARARTRARGSQRQRAWRRLIRADFLRFHLVVAHLPLPVAASYSRTPGSIHRRTTFVLSLCPLTFESDRRRWAGSTGKTARRRPFSIANSFGEELFRSLWFSWSSFSAELLRRALRRISRIYAMRLYSVSFARRRGK